MNMMSFLRPITEQNCSLWIVIGFHSVYFFMGYTLIRHIIFPKTQSKYSAKYTWEWFLALDNARLANKNNNLTKTTTNMAKHASGIHRKLLSKKKPIYCKPLNVCHIAKVQFMCLDKFTVFTQTKHISKFKRCFLFSFLF